MTDPNRQTTPGIHDELRIAYLTESHPITLLENLPNPVFPVKLTVRCPPTRDGDVSHPTYSQPEYPVDTSIPQAPYIPQSTVYFDNPASRPPSDRQVWDVQDFIEIFSDQLDSITDERGDDAIPTRVLSATFTEIPYHYVTTDQETGNPVAKPDLYEDEAEFTIIEFSPDGGVSATRIRDEIEGLAGESVSPTRLTRMVEVTAKPTRRGRGTQQNPGRARYYTTAWAEKTGDLSRTPAVYAVDGVSGETRPLSPVIQNLDEFVPQLARADDIVDAAKLTGENREKTTFVADDIIN